MIKEFKSDNYKADSGIIYKGMLEQVKLLHQKDPVAAGELAISFMEEILTGTHSSDDFLVEFSLANFKIIIENNRNKKEAAIEEKKNREAEALRPIADLYLQGVTQGEIARRLNMTQSNVSKKLAKIRRDFPFLLNIPNIPIMTD